MKAVKLSTPALVGDINHAEGDVVMVPDVRAAELLRLGHAEAVDGSPKVANPDHNPFGDCIEPEPPGGLTLDPADALSPNVLDNPGLRKAVEISTAAVAKSSKVKADQVVEGNKAKDKAEDKVEPGTTANEVAPKK